MITPPEVLDVIWATIRNAVLRHPMSILREEFMKVLVSEALLTSGASLIEASNLGGTVNSIVLKDGRLSISKINNTNTYSPTKTDPKRGRGKPPGTTTSDVRLLVPEKLEFELKARCSFGSSNANTSKVLWKDIVRTVEGKVDAFFLAADNIVYRRLRSDKTEKRGNNRLEDHAQLFDSVFANCNDILLDTPSDFHLVTSTLGEVRRRHVRLAPPSADERVLVCLVYPKSPTLLPHS